MTSSATLAKEEREKERGSEIGGPRGRNKSRTRRWKPRRQP